MFGDEDDFEIDEEFLDGVFDAEKTANQSYFQPSTSSNHEDHTGDDGRGSPWKKSKLCIQPFKHSRQDSAYIKASATCENLTLHSVDSCATIKGTSRSYLNENSWEVLKRNSDILCEKRTDSTYHGRKLGGTEKRCASKGMENNLVKEKHPDPSTVVSQSMKTKTGSSRDSIWCSTTSNISRTRQRKFPGPAGLLPDRKLSFLPGSEFSEDQITDPEEPLCSQSALSVLDDGPWSALQGDLLLEGRKLLENYTVAWVKRKAAARQLIGQKVPFLAAVVKSLDCSSPDPCVVLRDATGEIPGTLHRSVWDTFGGQLSIGSALVLRLVGVLSTGISARRHYLNITDNNVVTIYSSSLDESSDSPFRGVKITQVHSWTLKQLLQTVNSWEEQSKKKKGNDQSVSGLNRFGHSSVSPALSASATQSVAAPLLSSRSEPQPMLSTARHHSNHAQTGLGRSQNNPRDNFLNTNSCSTSQSRFVPKKPLISPQTESKDNTRNNSDNTSGAILNRRRENCQSSAHQSIVGYSELENLDVSSVLEGIDSESLFGEF